MQTIPIQAVANQIVKVVLDGQNCQILIAQRNEDIFVDVNVNGVDLVCNAIARDSVPLVCREYAGFSGQLMFIDSSAADDPQFSGFGSRWFLVYLSESENELIQQ